MPVTEKLCVDPKLEFYIDKQAQLHIVTPHEHIVLPADDTYELLNGLGRQLNRIEENKPLFTWPWKNKI